MTHASILTGNSDGKDGHPIKRGVWLLKNLFDETPPPPPPNVPELNREEPKLKNLTIHFPAGLTANTGNIATANQCTQASAAAATEPACMP